MNLEKLKETARRFEQKEEWKKAIEVYLKAIQEVEAGRDPHPDLAVYNRVGDLYVRLNDTNAAIRAYERAADLYADQGFFNNAIALCGKILRINPARNQVYLKLAHLHARKNVSIEAKRNLLAYIERMHAANQLDEAFVSVKAYAEEFASNQELRAMLVDLLRAASRENEARDELAKMAVALEARGETVAAEQTRAQIVEIEVDFDTPPRDLPPRAAPEAPAPVVVPAARSSDLIFLDTGIDAPLPAPEPAHQPAVEAAPIIGSDALPVVVDGPIPALSVAQQAPALPKDGQSAMVGGFAGMDVPMIDAGAPADDDAVTDAADAPVLDGLQLIDAGTELTGEPAALEGLETTESLLAAAPPTAVSGERLDLEATSLGEQVDLPESSMLEGLESTMLAPDDLTPIDDAPADEASPALPILATEEPATPLAAGPAAAYQPAEFVAPEPAEIIELDGLEVVEPVEAEAAVASSEPADTHAAVPAVETALPAADAPLIELDIPRIDWVDAIEHDAPAEPMAVPASAERVAEPEPAAEPARFGGDDVQAEIDAAVSEAEPTLSATDDAAILATVDALDVAVPPLVPLDQHPAPAQVRTLVEELEERISDAPDDAVLHQRLGEALLEAGDGQRAVEEFSLALAAWEAAHDWDRAAYLAERLVELRPEIIRHYQKRVEIAFRRQDREGLVEAYLSLGDALVRGNAMEKALAVYQRVLDHDPENALAGQALATYAAPPPPPPPPPAAPPPEPVPPSPPAAVADFVDLGALIEAEPLPRDTRMRVDHKAPTGDEQQDFDDMLAAFKRGIETNLAADDYEAHYDLGIAFKEMGLLDEAISEFQKALRAPTGRLRTSEALALAFYEKGQLPIAEAVLRRAVASPIGLDDEKLGLLYWLGRVLEEQGKGEDSITFYERALAIDIHFMDVQDRMHRVTAGRQA